MADNQTYYEAIGIGAVANCTAYFSLGYLYGSLSRTDNLLMAQTLAIYSLANTIFNIILDLSTGGIEARPKTYLSILTVGEGALGALQILALRHLKLVGKVGTAIFAVGLYVRILYRLNDLNNHF